MKKYSELIIKYGNGTITFGDMVRDVGVNEAMRLMNAYPDGISFRNLSSTQIKTILNSVDVVPSDFVLAKVFKSNKICVLTARDKIDSMGKLPIELVNVIARNKRIAHLLLGYPEHRFMLSTKQLQSIVLSRFNSPQKIPYTETFCSDGFMFSDFIQLCINKNKFKNIENRAEYGAEVYNDLLFAYIHTYRRWVDLVAYLDIRLIYRYAGQYKLDLINETPNSIFNIPWTTLLADGINPIEIIDMVYPRSMNMYLSVREFKNIDFNMFEDHERAYNFLDGVRFNHAMSKSLHSSHHIPVFNPRGDCVTDYVYPDWLYKHPKILYLLLRPELGMDINSVCDGDLAKSMLLTRKKFHSLDDRVLDLVGTPRFKKIQTLISLMQGE